MRTKCSILLSSLFVTAVLSAAPDLAWVKAYQGKSTNEFVWDKGFVPLLDSIVPKKAAATVRRALGGPPGPVVVTDDRYFALSACVAHSCTEKGFLWFDSQKAVGVGGYLEEGQRVLFLSSKTLSPADFPSQLVAALAAWIKSEKLSVAQVRFQAEGKKPTPIALEGISGAVAAAPKTTGPSFDCAKATTPVEKALCADEELGANDRAMAKLYESILHGHSTVPAREQLATEQRAWMRGRDETCATEDTRKACLLKQYQERTEVLRHWIPKS